MSAVAKAVKLWGVRLMRPKKYRPPAHRQGSPQSQRPSGAAERQNTLSGVSAMTVLLASSGSLNTPAESS